MHRHRRRRPASGRAAPDAAEVVEREPRPLVDDGGHEGRLAGDEGPLLVGVVGLPWLRRWRRPSGSRSSAASAAAVALAARTTGAWWPGARGSAGVRRGAEHAGGRGLRRRADGDEGARVMTARSLPCPPGPRRGNVRRMVGLFRASALRPSGSSVASCRTRSCSCPAHAGRARRGARRVARRGQGPPGARRGARGHLDDGLRQRRDPQVRPPDHPHRGHGRGHRREPPRAPGARAPRRGAAHGARRVARRHDLRARDGLRALGLRARLERPARARGRAVAEGAA